MGVGRVGVVGLTAALLGLGGAPAVATTGAPPGTPTVDAQPIPADAVANADPTRAATTRAQQATAAEPGSIRVTGKSANAAATGARSGLATTGATETTGQPGTTSTIETAGQTATTSTVDTTGRTGTTDATSTIETTGQPGTTSTIETTGRLATASPGGATTTTSGLVKPKKKHHGPRKHRPRPTTSTVQKPKPHPTRIAPAKPFHPKPKPKHATNKSTRKPTTTIPPKSATGADANGRSTVKLPAPVVLTGPALMLATGIAALRGTGYDVDVTFGHDSNTVLTEHGSVDPATGAANLDATGTTDGHPVHTDVRQIGNQLWALINLDSMQSTVGSDPTKWMLIDRGQLNDPNDTLVNLSGTTDPLDIAGLMRKVTSLDQASPTRVSGIVDLTASTGVSAPTPEQLAFAGDVAVATPFTAAVDPQGRLIELRIEADSISPDLSRVFTFSQFGAPAPVTAPPAGQIMPAPDAAYQYFNGR